MKKFYPALIVSLLLLPIPAHAARECQGDLNKESFVDERKTAQKELQASIIELRKPEQTVGENPNKEQAAELAKLQEKVDKQEKTVKDLNSKYFPSTPVMAFGAACNDMRWLEAAKARLVEKPEHLGKKWYVWLDKTTRKPMASLSRPQLNVVAD